MSSFVRNLKRSPYKRPARRTRVKVSMTPEVQERLRRAARMSGMYFSDVVEQLVLQYVHFDDGSDA